MNDVQGEGPNPGSTDRLGMQGVLEPGKRKVGGQVLEASAGMKREGDGWAGGICCWGGSAGNWYSP